MCFLDMTPERGRVRTEDEQVVQGTPQSPVSTIELLAKYEDGLGFEDRFVIYSWKTSREKRTLEKR